MDPKKLKILESIQAALLAAETNVDYINAALEAAKAENYHDAEWYMQMVYDRASQGTEQAIAGLLRGGEFN